MNLATSEIVMVSLIPSLELLSFYILLLQEPTSLKIFSLLSRNQMNELHVLAAILALG